MAWLGGQPWKVDTLRSYRAALRVFYRWAVAQGHMPSSPAEALPPVKPGQHSPRPAPEQVVKAGLSAVEPRVRLMVRLAASYGLRRAEIAQVHLHDIAEDLGGWTLLVHGKGGKERILPIGADIAAELRTAGHATGWVFPGRTNGHLSADRVGVLIAHHLPEGWTAHPLRHRFATVTYAGSGDLLAVQQLLGHTRPETTQRYVGLRAQALRDAARWAA